MMIWYRILRSAHHKATEKVTFWYANYFNKAFSYTLWEVIFAEK